MYEDIALFLLRRPPLDEIGGTITDVIEKYRYNMLTKEQALDQMITLHEPFLVKYSERQAELNELLKLEYSI